MLDKGTVSISVILQSKGDEGTATDARFEGAGAVWQMLGLAVVVGSL